MVTIVNELYKRGWSVDLVVGSAIGPIKKQIKSEVNVVELGFTSTSKGLWRLIRYIRKRRPEILFSTITHVNILATLATRLSGTKTKVILREATTPSKAFANLGSAMKRNIRLSKLIYPWADAFVAVSEGVKQDLIHFCKIKPDKIECIYNPVVSDELFQKAQEQPTHKWLNKNKDYKVILGAGRFAIPKDFVTLIRAFDIVRKKINTRLIIIGNQQADINEYNIIKEEVSQLGLEELVDFPGFQSNPFVYFKAVDVYVLSSIHEGLPSVLIQALACGTPVVSTNCASGIKEILGEEKYGFIVPIKQPQSLANAIVNQLLSPMPDKTMRLERAENFNVDAAIDKIESLLENNLS